MEITVEELMALDKNIYRLIDIRSEADTGYGIIEGAESIPLEKLFEVFLPMTPNADSLMSASVSDSHKKKLIIYCSRGVVSIDAAKELCEKGYEAYSL